MILTQWNSTACYEADDYNIILWRKKKYPLSLNPSSMYPYHTAENSQYTYSIPNVIIVQTKEKTACPIKLSSSKIH